MSKRIIGFIIGFVIIGLLGGLIYWLFTVDVIVDDYEEKSISEIQRHARQTLIIFQSDLANVDYISVSNGFGEYRVVRAENNLIQIVGREGAPLFPYSSKGLYESVERVMCDDLIEIDSKTFAYYGLDKPQSLFTVMMKDGSMQQFAIGDKEPMGTGYYIRDTANDDVYLVNTFFAERLVGNYLRLYDTKISKELDPLKFEYINIYRPNAEDKEIFIRETDETESKDITYMSGMIMEKPFFFGAESLIIQKALEQLIMLEASEIVADRTDDEILEKYGFIDPAVVEFVIDGQKSVYELGNTQDRLQFVRYNGAPVIYAVDIDVFAFIYKPVDDFCQRILNIKYLNELAYLTVETGGKLYRFDITDPDKSTEMVVMYEFAPLKQDLFRSFYKSIIGVTHFGLAERPESEPTVTITLGTIAPGENVVVEFLPINDRNSFMLINGEGRFYVLNSRVDKVIKDMFKLLNGEEIMS